MIETVVNNPENEPVDKTTPFWTCKESKLATPLVVIFEALRLVPVRDTNVPVES